ncbi:hypothetical protein [Flavobacterium sp. 3HN19-14]
MTKTSKLLRLSVQSLVSNPVNVAMLEPVTVMSLASEQNELPYWLLTITL